VEVSSFLYLAVECLSLCGFIEILEGIIRQNYLKPWWLRASCLDLLTGTVCLGLQVPWITALLADFKWAAWGLEVGVWVDELHLWLKDFAVASSCPQALWGSQPTLIIYGAVFSICDAATPLDTLSALCLLSVASYLASALPPGCKLESWE
jgi:hypothetical protein